MDYGAIYTRLVARAQSRELTVYGERHHIVPRCMGGSNDAENIVKLTAEEHFMAHKLLVKIHPGVSGLVFAMLAMSLDKHGGRTNNKLFGWARREVYATRSRVMTGVSRGPASQQTREKMSAAHRGRPKTPEHIAKVGAAVKGKVSCRKGVVLSPETKERMRLAALARNPEASARRAARVIDPVVSARAHKAWATKRAKSEAAASQG